MADPMRIRANNKDGVTEVRVLMSHVMESGARKDAAGATIPAHYIKDLEATPVSYTHLDVNKRQAMCSPR